MGRLVCATLVVLVLAFTAWLNAVNLMETYGSGPPYYGRTANMDKWESPVPFLLAVDALACIVLAALISRPSRGRRTGRGGPP